ncbi:guanylate kinase [Halothermothrix orenii]|uniref:Guanylate kinase n=1 Tax=Halothermothrix orenii (strain H 168 / OCM 544 / DSM 9562) TaxID=373903 RepID=B8CWR8_HALOH|nr:guanylate kinase [Halothermothrix orenii]ACL69737.1 Guanylate kinase [Halothermothrix orenii H 168]
MGKGKLFVLSGPSGVGKGTVLDKLLSDFKDVQYSVSATTRKPRPGEKDGVDYFFLSREKFFKMVENNEFIEWAEVHNNYYGTPKIFVDKCLAEGKDVILEIDIQGARQVKKLYPDAIFIFLVPPSLNELKRRLNHRGSEDEKNMKIRLNNAEDELKEVKNYDYKVVNDRLDDAVEKLKSIIIAEKCKIREEDCQ